LPSTGNCVIAANPTTGNVPLSVSFSIATSTFQLSGQDELLWDFGDGSPDTKITSAQHTYQQNGVYTVKIVQQNGMHFAEDCTAQITVGGQAGGQCQPPTSGPCSVSALQSSCFGSNAQTAAGVCMIESSGNPLAQSGTDKCDGGEPVSIGLFQINISANQINGLNCPSAFDHPFSGSHPTCHVLNQSLYQQCISAAQNAGDNIAKACQMSGNGNHFCQWGPATKTKCGLNCK
jgi:hypothetical protein